MKSRPQPAALCVALGISLAFLPSIQAAPRHATPKHEATTRQAARPTHHPKGRSSAVFPTDAETSPAYRYAQLDATSCYAELEKRQLPVRREDKSWPGITLPVRFTGPVNGVVFRTDILEAERATSAYELFDCRLALAIGDFARLLRAEGINEAVLSSAYRPPPKSAPNDEPAKRHAGGLAVDIHRLRREDGRWFKVEKDFHGRIGAMLCGNSAASPIPTSEEAALLRRVVCGAAEQRLFHSILTPNYDYPHRNHLHFELVVGVRWFIVS